MTRGALPAPASRRRRAPVGPADPVVQPSRPICRQKRLLRSAATAAGRVPGLPRGVRRGSGRRQASHHSPRGTDHDTGYPPESLLRRNQHRRHGKRRAYAELARRATLRRRFGRHQPDAARQRTRPAARAVRPRCTRMWLGAQVSGLLGNQLPGPGTVHAGQDLEFLAVLPIGEQVTITITATAKDPAARRVTFDCRGVNGRGETIMTGTARVIAPAVKVTMERPEAWCRCRSRATTASRLSSTAAGNCRRCRWR
jgi:hypothetical protein